MIVNATGPDERAEVQESVDVLIALAGAGGGARSGVVTAATKYNATGGAALALLSLRAIAFIRRRRVPENRVGEAAEQRS